MEKNRDMRYTIISGAYFLSNMCGELSVSNTRSHLTIHIGRLQNDFYFMFALTKCEWKSMVPIM